MKTFLLAIIMGLSPFFLFSQNYYSSWTKNIGWQEYQVLDDFYSNILSVIDSNNNIIIASINYNETTGVHDLILSKYDVEGNIVWQDKFNLPNYGNIVVGDLQIDNTGVHLPPLLNQ